MPAVSDLDCLNVSAKDCHDLLTVAVAPSGRSGLIVLELEQLAPPSVTVRAGYMNHR